MEAKPVLQQASFVSDSTRYVVDDPEKELDRDPLQDLINVLDNLVTRSSITDEMASKEELRNLSMNFFFNLFFLFFIFKKIFFNFFNF